jgi:hypothetical protein
MEVRWMEDCELRIVYETAVAYYKELIIFLEGLRKTKKNFGQNVLSLTSFVMQRFS